jgi:S-adenosylmethionine decarboxylase
MGMAVCDIFTCGDHSDPQLGVEYMKTQFGSEEIICSEFVRPLE